MKVTCLLDYQWYKLLKNNIKQAFALASNVKILQPYLNIILIQSTDYCIKIKKNLKVKTVKSWSLLINSQETIRFCMTKFYSQVPQRSKGTTAKEVSLNRSKNCLNKANVSMWATTLQKQYDFIFRILNTGTLKKLQHLLTVGLKTASHI